MTQLTNHPAWKALNDHHHEMRDLSLREELAHEGRFSDLSRVACGILFDFSKHLANKETINLLVDLAHAAKVDEMRAKMFAGVKINNTEDRAVLHTACRAPETAEVVVDDENIIPFVHQVLSQMEDFTHAVRSGEHKGYTDEAITDVVNIGIGGSDLGPRFVVEALQEDGSGPKVHFVSNVDGQDIASVLKKLKPETTLFVIASKTFATEETMLNAQMAKDWLLKSATTDAIPKHFVALSTNAKGVKDFGISLSNMFPFRDWVGGRYSLWSAIGLSISLAVGFDNFRKLLDGAHDMDQHFQNAEPKDNVPLLMGMLGVWYRNFYNYSAHLLLPYDVRMDKMAKFIQQMDMESNGKAVDREGHHMSYATGPLIFGEPGTDSQHSFMQWVHQSADVVPVDFMICKEPHHALAANHASLCANFLAQSRALALGQTLEEAKGDPSRVFTGNRPSTSIVLPKLSPYHLGALIAAYEHKVFVQGVVWGVNSFDQPGVELGKKLAKPIKEILEGRTPNAGMDSSTSHLINVLMPR
ncbi:MAG: glucose-6-phosphate isomerase [Alphaproteobacteria bacterium]|nr:glucose-6-phosphate isomerase [Alphaproteobacteria bacterium]